MFSNTPISWSSKLQKSTALSSCKAKYIALKEGIKEYIYLINVYKRIGIDSLLKTKESKFYLFCNN